MPTFQKGELVVEVTSAAKSNLLYRAYRVLCAIGVQVVQTRLRLVGDRAIQTLHLAELDDGGLAPGRVSQVVNALRIACGLPTIIAGDVVHASVPATVTRAAFDPAPRLVKTKRPSSGAFPSRLVDGAAGLASSAT